MAEMPSASFDHLMAIIKGAAQRSCVNCGGRLPRKTLKFCSASCANEGRPKKGVMGRFWAKVDKTPGNGPSGDCWHWTARVDGRGYGEMKVFGVYRKAHRLALFGVAERNESLFACHHCDNPRCVRPDHLFPGTALDNVRDMIAKGRGRRAKN